MNTTPKILLGTALLAALLSGCKREETTVVPPATETPATTSGTSGTTGATGTGTDPATGTTTDPATGTATTGPGSVPNDTTTPPTGATGTGTGTGTAINPDDKRDKDKRDNPPSR